MFALHLLLSLLMGLAVAQEVLPVTEDAGTLDVTEKTFIHSTDPQTQASTAEINVTEFIGVTESSSLERATLSLGNDNSTDIVVTEDPEGLGLATLVGIVAGVITLIGISAIIIIVIVRKMGRYSPGN
ncbi:podoplanin isoform X2 [Spea bombifrons]|uniref:podoplanin isoform X2 n=1 Tax=Spea bombifrons TaxID=233779 RepID=UPI00234B8988|nr:podoplanin isoform X2 [Spea bombifrons]